MVKTRAHSHTHTHTHTHVFHPFFPLLTLTFDPAAEEFFLRYKSTPAKPCELDPIPIALLYENLDILLLRITNVIILLLTLYYVI